MRETVPRGEQNGIGFVDSSQSIKSVESRERR